MNSSFEVQRKLEAQSHRNHWENSNVAIHSITNKATQKTRAETQLGQKRKQRYYESNQSSQLETNVLKSFEKTECSQNLQKSKIKLPKTSQLQKRALLSMFQDGWSSTIQESNQESVVQANKKVGEISERKSMTLNSSKQENLDYNQFRLQPFQRFKTKQRESQSESITRELLKSGQEVYRALLTPSETPQLSKVESLSTHNNLFRSHQRNAVSQQIVEKIQQNCFSQILTLRDLNNKSALSNASHTNSIKGLSKNRTQLMRFILDKDIPTKPSTKIVQTKCKQTPSLSPRHLPKSVLKQFSKLEELTSLTQNELQQKLHKPLRPIDDSNLSVQFTYYEKKRQKEIDQQLLQIKDGYVQTKYLDHGQLGSKYAYEEYLEEQKEQQLQNKIKSSFEESIDRRKKDKMTDSKVIKATITKDQAEEVQILITRPKQEFKQTEEQKNQGDFEGLVQTYISDLAQSKGFKLIASVDTTGTIQQMLQLVQQQRRNQAKQSKLLSKKLNKNAQFVESHLTSSIINYFAIQIKKPPKLSYLERKLKESYKNKLQFEKAKFRVQKQEVQEMSMGQIERFIYNCENTLKIDLVGMMNKILEKNIFAQMCNKAALQPGIAAETLQHNTEYNFFQGCESAHELCLDILMKIQNYKLELEEYKLTDGVCLGFFQACQSEKDLLNKVHLSNCGISHYGFNTFIKGLLVQRRILKLTIHKQNICTQTAERLAELVSREILELRFIGCKIDSKDLTTLLKGVEQGAIKLNKFALSGFKVNQEHLSILQNIVEEAAELTLLDLSWLQTQATDFLPVLVSICEKMKLLNLNLSWTKLALILQNNEEEGQPDIQNKKHNEKVLELLAQFFQRSEKLNHIDLTQCDLDSDILQGLAKPIKKSHRLVGVHLTSNIGLNKQTKNFITKKLNCTYQKSLNFNTFQQRCKNDLRLKTTEEKKKEVVLEAILTKEIARKKYFESQQIRTRLPQSQHFILTRKIGHDFDIPGSQYWTLHTHSTFECYVCDKKIYTLFFWSPDIGIIEGQDVGLTPKQKYDIARYVLENRQINEQLIERIQKVDQRILNKEPIRAYDQENEVYYDIPVSRKPIIIEKQELTKKDSDSESVSEIEEKEKPYVSKGSAIILKNLAEDNFSKKANNLFPQLYGSFNNWMPQPMVPIHELCYALDKNPKPDFFELLKKSHRCREHVFEENKLKKDERKCYFQLREEYRLRFTSQKTNEWAKHIEKLICYEEPHFTSISNLKKSNINDIYLGATFISSGKRNYMVQYGDEFYFHQTIANHRREELKFHNIDKLLKQQKERNPNVFKKWIRDTPKHIEKSIIADQEGWRVNDKFIKDASVYSSVIELIKDNYVFLRDIFMMAASQTTFPFVNMAGLHKIFSDSELLDKTLTTSLLDHFVKSSRNNIQKTWYLLNQKDDTLTRFEFFECLLRIAKFKYENHPNVKSPSQAMSMLIEHMKPYFEEISSQKYRDNYVWTKFINLILDANKKNIRFLYQSYTKETPKYGMSLREALNLMTNETTLKLNKQDAMFAYAMSLQGCVSIIKNQTQHMLHISLLEFMELIVRYADCVINDKIALTTKVEKVLDEWLALVGRQRIHYKLYQEESSDEEETFVVNHEKSMAGNFCLASSEESKQQL